MILRTRTWIGGSTYEVTVSPETMYERLPLPGEAIVVGEMGWTRVTSARDISPGGQGAGWRMPAERLWRLRIQTPEIGPGYDNV